MDLPGYLTLAGFVFSIPAIYLNQQLSGQWICQVFAIAAIVTNFHYLNPIRFSLPIISLGALWIYFSITALSSQDPQVRDSFIVWSKFSVFIILLSLVVCKRVQLLIVLAAMAASAIVVAYASHSELTGTREALSEARVLSGTAELARTSGAFANANIMAMYAVDAILAGVVLYFTAPNWLTLLLCISSGSCAAYLALFSGSRKAILGMVCIAAFIGWIVLGRRKRAALGRQFVGLLLVAAGFVWLVSNPYITRFDSSEESYQLRVDLVKESWEAAQANGLWGLGYHGFQQSSRSGSYTHSTPLELLCNGGVIALVIYITFWLGLCRSLVACLARETDEREIVLLYGIVCFCLLEAVNSLTSVVIEEPRYLVLMACVCGYLRTKELESRRFAGGCFSDAAVLGMAQGKRVAPGPDLLCKPGNCRSIKGLWPRA